MVIAKAHHGSVSKEQRVVIEDDLKRGRLPCVVATSSLELGIDMGAVDLVIQIESPPSVASALQRVGRAGHQVGEVSRGVLFPKHRGDLAQTAVAVERMRSGAIESMRVPTNPLDVLAQQVVATTALEAWAVDDLYDLVRRSAPFAALPRSAFEATLDLLSGRYPSDEFAELRPRIVWDRVGGTITGRPGAQRLAVTSGGTIPDRGLFGVFLVGEGTGRRVGELDEEMVYESRVGDVFALGATSWRIEDITHDRVLVTPAPGIPGRLPFWKGDTLGRPAELGEAIGGFTRELGGPARRSRPTPAPREAGLDEYAADNLVTYVHEQVEATRRPAQRPHAPGRAVPRRARRLAAGPALPLRHARARPVGAGHQRPAARALRRRRPGHGLRRRHRDPHPRHRRRPAQRRDRRLRARRDRAAGHRRGRRLRAVRRALPRVRGPRPAAAPPRPRPPLARSGSSASARPSCSRSPPSTRPSRSSSRPSASASRTSTTCPRWSALMRRLDRREVSVTDIETQTPSPYARTLLFGYVAQFVYEGDSPIAERRAAALSLDQGLLAELLGRAELRELLDPEVLAEVEAELQRLVPDRQAQDVEGVADLLRLLGPLTVDADRRRAPCPAPTSTTASSGSARRGAPPSSGWPARSAGPPSRTSVACATPSACPCRRASPTSSPSLSTTRSATWSPATPAPTVPSPSTTSPTHLGLGAAVVRHTLQRLGGQGRVLDGEFRPAGTETEWCDAEVLRRLRRRSLARLRKEVEPVDPQALARFLPAWQSVAEGDSAGPPASWPARRRRRTHRHRPARRRPGPRLRARAAGAGGPGPRLRARLPRRADRRGRGALGRPGRPARQRRLGRAPPRRPGPAHPAAADALRALGAAPGRPRRAGARWRVVLPPALRPGALHRRPGPGGRAVGPRLVRAASATTP